MDPPAAQKALRLLASCQRGVSKYVRKQENSSRMNDLFTQQSMREARFQLFGEVYSISVTAWAAMPVQSPVKPIFSSVVALTLTFDTSVSRAAASFSRICGI